MKKFKNSKKLIAAASALVVAVALSAGTTFAWFTQNTTVSVSDLTASVESASGANIYIAVGEKDDTATANFQTSLSSTALTDYLNKTLKALTNANASSNATNIPSFVDVDNSSSYTANTDYLKIPIIIRTEAATIIYLDESSVTSTGASQATQIQEWRTDSGDITSYSATTSGVTYGTYYNSYACNAIRIGFTSLDAATSGATEQNNLQVWSPNEALYTGAQTDGTSLSEGTYRSTVTEKTLSDGNNWKNNLAMDYYKYIKGSDPTYATQVGYTSNYLAYEKNGQNVLTTTVAAASHGVQDADGYYYSYLYMYVWLEGTDGDCFNNILGQGIDITMKLNTTDLTATAG